MGDREFRDFEKNLRRTPKKSSEEDSSSDSQSVSSHPPTKMEDPYSHPVYNAISYINGQINRMDLFQVGCKYKC